MQVIDILNKITEAETLNRPLSMREYHNLIRSMAQYIHGYTLINDLSIQDRSGKEVVDEIRKLVTPPTGGAGNKIAAIKLYRSATMEGLLEAKLAVEHMMSDPRFVPYSLRNKQGVKETKVDVKVKAEKKPGVKKAKVRLRHRDAPGKKNGR